MTSNGDSGSSGSGSIPGSIMDTRSVCIAVAILLFMEVGPAAGTPVLVPSAPPLPRSVCGNITIVCTEGSDSAIPWTTFAISILLIFIPGFIRIWRLGPQSLGMRHRFFVWSLILGLGEYILWYFYTSPCRPAHSQFPILLTSAYGLLSHVVLIFMVTFKVPTSVSSMRLLSAMAAVISSLLLCGLLLSFAAVIDARAVIGWFSLGFGVLSHLFRIKSTDYDNHDWILLAFSILGTINGLLWLRHPNLCVARHYKLASYLVAALRGTEVYFWLSPRIGNLITRMEGPEEAAGAVNSIQMV